MTFLRTFLVGHSQSQIPKALKSVLSVVLVMTSDVPMRDAQPMLICKLTMTRLQWESTKSLDRMLFQLGNPE